MGSWLLGAGGGKLSPGGCAESRETQPTISVWDFTENQVGEIPTAGMSLAS